MNKFRIYSKKKNSRKVFISVIAYFYFIFKPKYSIPIETLKFGNCVTANVCHWNSEFWNKQMFILWKLRNPNFYNFFSSKNYFKKRETSVFWWIFRNSNIFCIAVPLDGLCRNFQDIYTVISDILTTYMWPTACWCILLKKLAILLKFY